MKLGHDPKLFSGPSSQKIDPITYKLVAVWWSSNGVNWAYQRIYSTLSLVSTGMGDRLRAGKPPRYVTIHSGQLSLAIPPWVGAMSTGDGFGHR